QACFVCTARQPPLCLHGPAGVLCLHRRAAALVLAWPCSRACFHRQERPLCLHGPAGVLCLHSRAAALVLAWPCRRALFAQPGSRPCACMALQACFVCTAGQPPLCLHGPAGVLCLHSRAAALVLAWPCARALFAQPGSRPCACMALRSCFVCTAR